MVAFGSHLSHEGRVTGRHRVGQRRRAKVRLLHGGLWLLGRHRLKARLVAGRSQRDEGTLLSGRRYWLSMDGRVGSHGQSYAIWLPGGRLGISGSRRRSGCLNGRPLINFRQFLRLLRLRLRLRLRLSQDGLGGSSDGRARGRGLATDAANVLVISLKLFVAIFVCLDCQLFGALIVFVLYSLEIVVPRLTHLMPGS